MKSEEDSNLTIVSLILPDSDSSDHVFRPYFDVHVVPSRYDVRYRHPEHLYFEPKYLAENRIMLISISQLLLYLSVRVAILARLERKVVYNDDNSH